MTEPIDSTQTPHGDRPFRRIYRPAGQRTIGGVAQGLADHFGVPVLWVRLAFVVATWFNLIGVVAYAAFWIFVPISFEDADSPGIDSATRRGLRTAEAFGRPGSREVIQTTALLAVGAGVVLLLSMLGWGFGGSLFIPILVGVTGLTLIWRQVDERRWNRWVVETSGWHAAVRFALGALLVLMALGFFVVGKGGWSVATDTASALGIALLGIALILGPWIYRLMHDLTDERRERIRSQERADVAAHLHDSVLQTLALLQKYAGDPGAVATLARRQERELRDWLYGGSDKAGETLRATLTSDAADIEGMHHVPIEVVGVGDAPMEPDVAAMARAAREAMTNAAKHSGADRIDVYVEVGAESADVFVRDRGAGFDPDTVADDRMGIRGSIEGRVERHGGSAVIKSSPGEGTEVRLTMPVTEDRAATNEGGRR